MNPDLLRPAELDWIDGEPFSRQFGDIYFSRGDGLQESAYVFLANNDLPGRWRLGGDFTIGELGFGTGLNFLLTLAQWRRHRRAGQRLHYLSVERFPLARADLERAGRHWPQLSAELDALLKVYPTLVAGMHTCKFSDGVTLTLLFGDVHEGLAEMDCAVDAWYLDGFDPKRNPDMWSTAICLRVAALSRARATLATFTVAGSVRRALCDAGFECRKVPGHGRKREMLVATLIRPRSVQSQLPWYARPPAFRRTGVAIVVGAGVAGCATAFTLRERGWGVTVLEAGAQIAHGASGTPKALVYPLLNADPGARELLYRRAYAFMLQRISRSPRLGAAWSQAPVEQRLSAEQVAGMRSLLEREPGLADWFSLTGHGGETLIHDRAGVLDPRALCDAMLDDVELRVGFNVADLRAVGQGWELVSTAGGRVRGDVVIVATGALAGDLLPGRIVPMRPLSGQVDLFDLPAGVAAKRPLIGDGYLIPFDSGSAWSGAGFIEPAQFNADQATIVNRERAAALLGVPGPRLGPSRERWSGTRATTADRLPLLGGVVDVDCFGRRYADLRHGRRHSDYDEAAYIPGLFVNAGHGARGMLAALFAGEFIGAEIEGWASPLELSLRGSVLPQRFMVRRLRKATA